MFALLKNIHVVSVILFLLIYVVKTILLLSNKTDVLDAFAKKIKIPEMIISVTFLVTGTYLLTQVPEIKTLMIIKIVLVLLSIPTAIIGFKKRNKILASLSLLMITASYGLAEAAAKNKAKVSTEAIANDGAINAAVLYTDNCATCHGADGKLGLAGAANISSTILTSTAISDIILKGKGLMAPVPLSPDQASAVATYVESNIKAK